MKEGFMKFSLLLKNTGKVWMSSCKFRKYLRQKEETAKLAPTQEITWAGKKASVMVQCYSLKMKKPGFQPCHNHNTANMSQCRHWLSHEMMSEEWAQTFHTHDASLHRSGHCIWLFETVGRATRENNNHKHKYQDKGRDITSVWNFCTSQTSIQGETRGRITKCHFLTLPAGWLCCVLE